MKKVLLGLVVLVVSVVTVSASQFLDQLKKDFTFAYDQYRDSYTEFSIARSQYQTVSTHANEEKLAEEAVVMLNSRDHVWWTYFGALKQEVKELETLNKTEADFMVATMSAHQAEIDEHKKRVNVTSTRLDLNDLALEINGKAEIYRAVSYYTLGKLRQGYILKALEEVEKYAANLEKEVELQVRNESVKAARLRGVKDVLRRADLIRGKLDEPQEEWRQNYQSGFSDSYYERIVEDYRPLYADLSQAYSLLVELSEDLEL